MKKRTYYHLVLDRSGSMESCWEEASQVITNQLKELARVQSENPESQILFSFCAFNQELQFSDEITDVKLAQIDWSIIFPEGMTALNDAIGESIAFVREKAGSGLESVQADVVMLILTDGFENASEKYSGLSIKEMIKSLELTEKWNFLFLGAGLNINRVIIDFEIGNKNSYSFGKTEFQETFNLVNDELEDFVKSKSKDKKKTEFFEKMKDQENP